MPLRLQDLNIKKCSQDKQCLIGIIIGSITIIILLAVLIPVLLTTDETNCNTSTCIDEAERIKQKINPDINPCDDFYEFSCGNYLQFSDSRETREPFKQLLKRAEEEIVQLHNTSADENDHYVVKLSRKLFRACMNTTAIEKETINTLKEVLRIVGGGWPLIEGNDWNETNFDWLQATYKLRERGFPFSIFLDLKVSPDPRNASTGYILAVGIPFDLEEATAVLYRKKGVIRRVASQFGVTIEGDSAEMKKLYAFAEKISDQMLHYRELAAYPVHTVQELQNNLGFINWLEFINNISGPTGQISVNDSIMVMEANTLRQRFDLLSKTPKRVQANYMMWKVIQHMIPYLTLSLRKLFPEDKPKQSRLSFCLKEIQQRFTVNPIDVLYARKYLSKARRTQVQVLDMNIKQAFLNNLPKIKWLSNEDKQNIEDKARNLVVVIGEPGGYFEDDILDNLNVDMKEMGKENFLNLLSQLNRNYISETFSKIKKSHSQMKVYKPNEFPLSQDIFYYPEHNLLRISASQLQNQVFNENRPNYLNYGILGKELGKELSSILKLSASYFDKDGNRISGWSQQTAEGYGNVTGCLIKNMGSFKQLTFDFMIIEMLAEIIGTKIAYNAYQNWAESNQKEPKLGNLEYSPEQLFWISTVFCYPNDTNEHPLSFLPDTRDLPRNMVYATVRYNPQFAKDFNCSSGSPMNPADKCELL